MKEFFQVISLTQVITLVICGILIVVGVELYQNRYENFALTRDIIRRSDVSHLGRALVPNYLTGTYTAPTPHWITTLQNGINYVGDIQNPSGPGYDPSTICSVNNQSGYCYSLDSTSQIAIIYTRAESSNYSSSACGANHSPDSVAWIVWSLADNRTGLYCGTSDEPVAHSFGDSLLSKGFFIPINW